MTFNYFLGDPISEFAIDVSLPSDDVTPYSYSEALLSTEWPKWEIAIQQELEACTRLKVWEKSTRPMNKKLIDTRWIFRKKHNPDGTIRYKARLVAKGYMQVYGDDFDMTFSPVARQTSIRTIYAISATHGLQIHQMDVNNAFLNPELDSTSVYISKHRKDIKD